MFDLIWALPLSLGYFWRGHRGGLNKSPFRYLRMCMLAFALVQGRRTMANVARCDGEGRHKSSYTRFFSETAVPMYGLQRELSAATWKLAVGLEDSRRRWFLLIDSNHSHHDSPEATPQPKQKGQRGPQRGQRLENAVRHRGGGKCSRITLSRKDVASPSWEKSKWSFRKRSDIRTGASKSLSAVIPR